MVNKPTSIEIMGQKKVSAVLSGPDPDQPGESNKTGVIIAHGAANDMNNILIVAVADSLATAGYTTLRFNFPYKEKGKKSPDTESTLIRTWQSAVSHILKNKRFPPRIKGVHFMTAECENKQAENSKRKAIT